MCGQCDDAALKDDERAQLEADWDLVDRVRDILEEGGEVNEQLAWHRR
jgi:hypothetical protein